MLLKQNCMPYDYLLIKKKKKKKKSCTIIVSHMLAIYKYGVSCLGYKFVKISLFFYNPDIWGFTLTKFLRHCATHSLHTG